MQAKTDFHFPFSINYRIYSIDTQEWSKLGHYSVLKFYVIENLDIMTKLVAQIQNKNIFF